jgi:hypothetical protein
MINGILIRNIRIDDIKLLFSLVGMYWSFEKFNNFNDKIISKQLRYLFSNPHLGMDVWLLQKKNRLDIFLRFTFSALIIRS